MLNNPWFRFGLPLGSAVVLAALLDTVMNLFAAWMDVGDIIIYYTNYDAHLDGVIILWITIIVIWILSNLVLLWYGVILQGSPTMLIAWLATTIVCTCIIVGAWTWMVFTYWVDWVFFISEVYSVVVYLIGNAYIVYIGVLVLHSLRSNEPVEPIGKGFQHIIKFYRDDLSLAAKCLLISELVFIGEYVFTRQMLKFAFGRELSGHEEYLTAAVIAEEYVIRFARFVIAGVGLYFLVKGQLPLLRFWGLFYLSTIISSIIIFFYLIFQWKANHAYFTLGYYILFLINLVYRGGVLFVCMKVVQPYIASGSFLTLNEQV